jgi:hypothetical protein
MSKKILVNYNFTPDPEWIGDDYLIYDRSDDGIDHLAEFDPTKIIKTENVGQVDFDKLNYLIDNYDNLPDVFLWGKTNLFKYITPEEYDKVKDNKFFTPLLTQNHKTYQDNNGWVCYYSENMYWERNNNWYLNQFPTKYFKDYGEFAHTYQLPNEPYIPFAPGGNYILTRDTVHKYSKDYYEKLARILPYCREPGEAQMLERSYYNLWR